MTQKSYVYILTNLFNTAFYVGVTSDLVRRIFKHKGKFVDGFTKRYKINKLVYFEVFDEIEFAIKREKQLKKWKREYKVKLIQKLNPEFNDLYYSICQ